MKDLFPMKRYIGIKIVEAAPLSLGAYNEYRGWSIPADEDPLTEGYLVRYPDGYETWRPKKQFEEANRRGDGMPFGAAIAAMKKGHCVARHGWNDKNVFIYYVAGSEAGFQDLKREAAEARKMRLDIDGAVGVRQKICGHIDMMTADGSVLVGWPASQTDMLSDDWYVVQG